MRPLGARFAPNCSSTWTQIPSGKLFHGGLLTLLNQVSFKADEPPPLAALQEKHWDPLLSWVRSTFDIRIESFESILFTPQPQETKDKLNEILSGFDQWEMAGKSNLGLAPLAAQVLIFVFNSHGTRHLR